MTTDGNIVDVVENPDTDTKRKKHHKPRPPIEEEPVEVETNIPVWEYKNVPDFYNRVRGALNIGNTLSDTVIDYFENAPMAEIKIKQLVPKWKELDGVKRLLFETCLIYQTCYAMCPQFSSNRITKMKDPSLEVDYAANTNERPCARFAELIEDLIAQLNDDEQAPFFFGFEVTPSAPNACCCHKKIFPHIIPYKLAEEKPCEDKPHHSPHRPTDKPDRPDVPEKPIEPTEPIEPIEPDVPIEGELPETPDNPNENTPLGAE